MGLLDYLFDSGTYGDPQGGLLSRLSAMQGNFSGQGFPAQGNQPSPLDIAQWPYGSAGAPSSAPASFADRFNALPGAPQPVAPSSRNLDQTFAQVPNPPNQAQPMGIGGAGGYQMPRLGNADLFQPQQVNLPPNAQPTQGQLPARMQQQPPMQPPQQPPMAQPTFLSNRGGLGAGVRGALNNFGAGPLGMLVGGIGTALGMEDPSQQNLRAQYESLRQALEANGEKPQAAASKAMVAVMNPEAAKTIIPELFTGKTELKMVKDQFGGEVPYSWNSREQTLTPVTAEGGGNNGAGVAGGGYFNKGVKEYDPSLPADQYLQQFAPDVQSAIRAYARGDSQPTGNARKGWAENVKKWATAWGDKKGEQVNDQAFYEKKKLKTDLGASGNSTMGGILDNGESSFAHLAELGKSFADLGSVSHNFPLGGYIAQGQNAIGSALGGSDTKGKLVAAKQNLTKYGQESTKFYAGTGGGVEERMAALKTVPPESSSGEEQAAYMEKEKQLMLDRLNNKFDHIRQTLGEEDGNKVIAKKMPTINQNIAKIDASIAKLRGEPVSSGLPSGWSVKVR